MKGYRCENLYGDGITDPVKVAVYETYELMNTDIPEYMVTHPDGLCKEDTNYLKSIIIDEALGTYGEADLKEFGNIVKKYCKKRNFCKWLCKSPEDVYDSYMKMYPEMNGIPYNEAVRAGLLDETEFTEYEIPEDAIILSDMGVEGRLYCWKRR